MSSTAATLEAKPGLLDRWLPIVGWLPTYDRKWLVPMEELWAALKELPDTSGITLIVGAPSLAVLLFMR
jgi:hypothetical protein